MTTKKAPFVLIVLDGWGYREGKDHNAIAEANTPVYDHLLKTYPHTFLHASQEHVGLPQGTIGNSEIGHMTMGAGKVMDTDLVRVSKAMENHDFYTNQAFVNLFDHVKKFNSTLHIMGLVSPRGVHSHQEHLHGFLEAAKKVGLEKVVIHAFTDGRDAPPQSAAEYLSELEKVISDLGIGYIATATGRYYSMDRDNNWDRTKKAEDAIFRAKGKAVRGQKPSETMKELYKEGIMDELLEPVIFLDDSGKAYKIEDNDGVFFFNFRNDRTRQLSQKILEASKHKNLHFVTLTEYHPAFESSVAFPPNKIETTLGYEISRAGLNQAHIAETDKYAHVTYFFNGGRQEPYENEIDILVESRKDIKTHDQAPEMKAAEITQKAFEMLGKGVEFILINYANADLVGHTANKPAVITAVETLDTELEKIVEKVLSLGGSLIVTADHGNAEVNFDEKAGVLHTAHTTNLVPFILVREGNYKLKESGSLADVAPTILQLMNLNKPKAMTGQSLIK